MEFGLFYLLTIIFKFTKLTIKKKFMDYEKVANDIIKIKKKHNIKSILFLSCRKLASYIYFYTKILPIKIKIKKNPVDQFDIWSKKIKPGKYILIDYNKINKLDGYEIISFEKKIYNYNNFYIHIVKKN